MAITRISLFAHTIDNGLLFTDMSHSCDVQDVTQLVEFQNEREAKHLNYVLDITQLLLIGHTLADNLLVTDITLW